MIAALAGCRAQPAPVGASGTPAIYEWGVLHAELPVNLDVLTVSAAAEVTLRERGYSITHRAGLADRAELLGSPGGGYSIPDVLVVVSNAAQGTGLAVKVMPLGDEVYARVLMESILNKLGR